MMTLPVSGELEACGSPAFIVALLGVFIIVPTRYRNFSMTAKALAFQISQGVFFVTHIGHSTCEITLEPQRVFLSRALKNGYNELNRIERLPALPQKGGTKCFAEF